MIREARLKVISVEDFAKAAEAAVKLALIVEAANSMDLDISFTSKEENKKTRDTSKKD